MPEQQSSQKSSNSEPCFLLGYGYSYLTTPLQTTRASADAGFSLLALSLTAIHILLGFYQDFLTLGTPQSLNDGFESFFFFTSFLGFWDCRWSFPSPCYVSAPPPKMVPFQLPPGVLRTPFGWLRRVRWQRRPARGWGASPAAGRGVEGGCNSRTWGACEAYMPCVWLSWILVQQFVDPNICTNLSEFTSMKIVEWV